MRVFNTATKWIFIICLPALFLTASIGWAVNSLWLYQSGFEKYDIAQKTDLADSELDKTARGLISYFNSGEEYISISVTRNDETFELFNQREVIHLKDVKSLIRLDYWVLLGTFIYTLAYVLAGFLQRKPDFRKQLLWNVVRGSSVTLGLMLALGLGTLAGFDRLFLQFHLLSFANDFWRLDPARDYLVMLFPQGFWYDTTLLCALITTGLAIVLGGAAMIYLVLSKNGDNN